MPVAHPEVVKAVAERSLSLLLACCKPHERRPDASDAGPATRLVAMREEVPAAHDLELGVAGLVD
jgi:hypothetical protein